MMSVSTVSSGLRLSHPMFDRQIRRLAWFALLATVVLNAPLQFPDQPVRDLAIGMADLILVVAVWSAIRDTDDHVRRDRARDREAFELGRQNGACQAAAAIQDRVANSLSLTLGYAELLEHDGRLPPDVQDHAQKAIQAAHRAAQDVADFRKSLGCAPGVPAPAR